MAEDCNSSATSGSRTTTSNDFDLDLAPEMSAYISVENHMNSLYASKNNLKKLGKELEAFEKSEQTARARVREAEKNLHLAELNLDVHKDNTMHATNRLREAKAEFWDIRSQIKLQTTRDDHASTAPSESGSAKSHSQAHKCPKREPSDDDDIDEVQPQKKVKTSPELGHTSGVKKA